MKRVVLCLCAVLLSGCAASRGFVTGMFGGVAVVDEVTRGEAQKGSAHTELKSGAHMVTAATLAAMCWPCSVALVGASGIYGAYQFWKFEKPR